MPHHKVELRKPSRIRLVDDVRHSLEEAILSGQMRPGEHLAETHIAEHLGVSRTTVREALLMLEQQGLVVSVPRRGTFVTRLSDQDALDLSYLRILLEGFALTVGYQRVDQAWLSQLADCIAEMRTCRVPEDVPRLIQIDLTFHGLLIELADSPRLKELWSTLNGQIGALFLRGVETHRFSSDDVADLHQTLLSALGTGDLDQMLQGLAEHYAPGAGAIGNTSRRMVGFIEALALRYLAAGKALDGSSQPERAWSTPDS